MHRDVMLHSERPSAVPTPAVLATDHVSKTYGGRTPTQAILDLSIAVRPGEFVSLIGPSGCGKSTLFSIIAGLQTPSSGTVSVNGSDATGRLGLVGLMPQKDLLLPWKKVLENTALGAQLAGMPKGEARREALRWFPRFGLDGFESAYPAVLSGGMRQRAALLRTILTGRQILLLDEPFGALDALTRADMQSWLLDLRHELNATILLITHDVEEAIYLSDRVYVMSPRPGTIVADVPVRLPAERVHDRTVTSPDFVALKEHLLAVLRRSREVMR